MTNVPAATVVIPLFNSEDFIGETLASVANQTLAEWECIVVDDGSTDSSARLVEELSQRDPRVQLVHRDRTPKGACTARNIGAIRAKSRFLLFLDSDDVLDPVCLEQRVKIMEGDSSLDFAVFPTLLFDDEPGRGTYLWNIETDTPNFLRVLYLDPICQTAGILWRRDRFVESMMWQEGLGMWQDIDLHLRAFSGGYRYVVRMDQRPDVLIRRSSASLSRGGYHERGKLESRAEVARLAIRNLRRSGHEDDIREVRYMAGSVINGAILAGHFDLAESLIDWFGKEGALGGREAVLLRASMWLRRVRADRLPGVRYLREGLVRQLGKPSTIGLVPYQAT